MPSECLAQWFSSHTKFRTEHSRGHVKQQILWQWVKLYQISTTWVAISNIPKIHWEKVSSANDEDVSKSINPIIEDLS